MSSAFITYEELLRGTERTPEFLHEKTLEELEDLHVLVPGHIAGLEMSGSQAGKEPVDKYGGANGGRAILDITLYATPYPATNPTIFFKLKCFRRIGDPYDCYVIPPNPEVRPEVCTISSLALKKAIDDNELFVTTHDLALLEEATNHVARQRLIRQGKSGGVLERTVAAEQYLRKQQSDKNTSFARIHALSSAPASAYLDLATILLKRRAARKARRAELEAAALYPDLGGRARRRRRSLSRKSRARKWGHPLKW